MARASREAKAESEARIIDAAAALFRQRGFAATSVADVMEAAGMTHGGFYRHFASKEALAEAAIDHAVNTSLELVELDLREREPRIAVQRYIDRYLSDEHVDSPARGCPLAALAREASLSGTELAAAYGRGMQRTIKILASGMQGSHALRRRHALQLLVVLVGAVSLARASDPPTRRDTLAAARRIAIDILTEAA